MYKTGNGMVYFDMLHAFCMILCQLFQVLHFKHTYQEDCGKGWKYYRSFSFITCLCFLFIFERVFFYLNKPKTRSLTKDV